MEREPNYWRVILISVIGALVTQLLIYKGVFCPPICP